MISREIKSIGIESNKDYYKLMIRTDEYLRYAESVHTVDGEHGIVHAYNVRKIAEEIIHRLGNTDSLEGLDVEVCVLASYCHDVGRALSAEGIDHEYIGAVALADEMSRLGVEGNTLQTLYNAIIYHKWSMKPKTLEGIIVRDADKLDWVSEWRWQYYIENKIKREDIATIDLLPILRNEILQLECSKQLYDKMVYEIGDYLKHYEIDGIIK